MTAMSRRRGHLSAVALLLAVALLPAMGCGKSGTLPPATALGDRYITVGSFDFSESELLAEVYSQALEHAGFYVRRSLRLGSRELVAPALGAGLVEVLPEYAGTALLFHSLGAVKPTADVAATHDALVAALRSRGLVALDPAPAQDANTFVVTRRTADVHGLRTLSDLAPVGGQLVFGGPPECPSRPLCLAGLRDTYGVRFRQVVQLDAGGPLSRQALVDGHVDVALLFTTDPSLGQGDLVQLTDDRALQPAENVTPIVHPEVVARFGSRAVDALDNVSHRLTTEDVRAMNDSVQRGASAHAAAAAWLSAIGL